MLRTSRTSSRGGGGEERLKGAVRAIPKDRPVMCEGRQRIRLQGSARKGADDRGFRSRRILPALRAVVPASFSYLDEKRNLVFRFVLSLDTKNRLNRIHI